VPEGVGHADLHGMVSADVCVPNYKKAF